MKDKSTNYSKNPKFKHTQIIDDNYIGKKIFTNLLDSNRIIFINFRKKTKENNIKY